MIIKYFSWIREHVGKSEENFDLPSNVTTINELIDHLNGLNNQYKKYKSKDSYIKKVSINIINHICSVFI